MQQTTFERNPIFLADIRQRIKPNGILDDAKKHFCNTTSKHGIVKESFFGVIRNRN